MTLVIESGRPLVYYHFIYWKTFGYSLASYQTPTERLVWCPTVFNMNMRLTQDIKNDLNCDNEKWSK